MSKYKSPERIIQMIKVNFMVHYSDLHRTIVIREYNKILFCKAFMILVISMTISCSESPNIDELPILSVETPLDKIKKEYNITKEGLFLESASNGIDTMQLFVNGRFNENLWVGCYDKTTKKQIFEWVEKEKLDTIFHLNIGYGEYSQFKIKVFHIRHPYYVDGQLYFILWGYNPDVSTNIGISGRVISSDLYFIKNNNLIKKHRSFTYPTEAFYQEIKPWHNSVFSKYQYGEYICFSSKGDSLYLFDNVSYWDNYIPHFSPPNLESCEPINIEECVAFCAEYITNDKQEFNFKRLNLKTKEIIWKNELKPLENIPINDRLDNTTIEKNNDIWIYSFFYTSFTDGAKYTKRLNLNIKTGEFSN